MSEQKTTQQPEQELSEQRRVRREKLAALQAAGRIVFGRVRQDGELFQNVHLTAGLSAAGHAAGWDARWRR